MSMWNPGYSIPEPNPEGAEDQAGTSNGAVDSVNGQDGDVVLDASGIPLDVPSLTADDVEEGIDEVATLAAEALEAANDVLQPRGGLVTSGSTVDVSVVDIQEFTTAGAHTWTKPDHLTADSVVRVMLVSGGSGGGSGRKGAEASDRGGGAGGHGAVVREFTILASLLDGTEAVTVGAGGPGGPSQTTNSTDGTAGTVGGASIFNGISSGQPAAGAAGSSTSVIANVLGAPYGIAFPAAASSRPTGLGGLGASAVAGLSTCPGTSGFAGGGSGGSFRTAANANVGFITSNGSDGTGATGGVGVAANATGTVGGTSPDGQRGGGGGSGGGMGQTGGAGGWPGGGGGGGGAGINGTPGTPSGAGGAGSHGYVRIETIR